MENKLLLIFHRMERGIRKIMTVLNDPSLSDEPHMFQAVSDMAVVASVVIQQMKPSLHLMAQGEPLQSILGISEATLQSLYGLAHYLYTQQHYEEAAGAFYLLSMLNPSYHTFWVGMGHCEYILRRYQEALLAYTFAAQVMPSDPTNHVLIARCHMAMGNFSAAAASMSIAEMACSDAEATEKVKKQIEQMRADTQRNMI
jgi:type III secretion system low calcium response chaperone LcrH/SycD